MKLSQLRQFVAVAETLNFHRAAEKLHISQAPLSMAIKRLESSFGIQLFNRTSQSVKLTEAGRSIIEHARNVVFYADQLTITLQQFKSGQAGILRLHVVPSFMLAFLPSAISKFGARFPNINFEIAEDGSQSILSSIQAGTADLGVVRLPCLQSNILSVEEVQRDTYVVALPVCHPLAQNQTVELKGLARSPFILPYEQTSPSVYTSIMALTLQAGFSPIVAQRAKQITTILALVESGLGVALVPKIWERGANRGIVFRPLSSQLDITTGLGVVYRRGTLTTAGRFLISAIRDAAATA